MQTRSSSSVSAEPVPLGFQFPASHRREAQLHIVDSISFRNKVLPGRAVVNQPRSSSPSSYESVDTYSMEPGTGRYLTGEVDDTSLTRAGAKQNHRSVEHASRGFRLPKGWSVEEYPRKNSHRVDNCYVERKTGKRFRSLVSVERYLKESGDRTDQQELMLLQYHRVNSKDFSLPAGWIIDEKPRRNSSYIDKTYIETATGNKFRSMAAVERYLKAVDSVSMVHPEQVYLTRFETEVIDSKPPEKVKWVLTGSEGNMFTANMSGSDVSSSVEHEWSEAFVSLIQDCF